MAHSYDQSHLDKKYFIDSQKYNCPYCNRRSVTYQVIDTFFFHWTNARKVYGYLVACGGDSCQQVSLHLSNIHFDILERTFKQFLLTENGKRTMRSVDALPEGQELDSLFFYHQPTTFFTLDSRISEGIRTLIAEAEGCAKMNYLVGASGCLRKAIYELLDQEKIGEKDGKGDAMDYETRIKLLKAQYPMIPKEYFDGLANIQSMTSKRLHEGKWRAWTAEEFKYLVEIVKEVLSEMYVKPKEQSSVLGRILALRPQPNQGTTSGPTEPT